MFSDALGQWGNLQSESVVSAVSSANDLCSAHKALTSFLSRLGDEGIVAKRRDRPYRSGRSPD